MSAAVPSYKLMLLGCEGPALVIAVLMELDKIGLELLVVVLQILKHFLMVSDAKRLRTSRAASSSWNLEDTCFSSAITLFLSSRLSSRAVTIPSASSSRCLSILRSDGGRTPT